MYTNEGRQICFLTDSTFFHEAFVPQYDFSKDARWIFYYTMIRRAFSRTEQLLITPKGIFNKVHTDFLQSESLKYVYLIRKIAFIPPLQDPDPSNEIIKIATILSSHDYIPLIISSRSEDKWLNRLHKLGMAEGIGGFTKVMSRKRKRNKFPAMIINSLEAKFIIRLFDPRYEDIDDYVNLE